MIPVLGGRGYMGSKVQAVQGQQCSRRYNRSDVNRRTSAHRLDSEFNMGSLLEQSLAGAGSHMVHET